MDIQSQRNDQHHIQVDEESIDYIIKHTPLVLDSLDSGIIEVGNYYLPRSTGFEMEFDNDGELNDSMFSHINLLDLDINNAEQRFRIPKGIKGLQSLYQISKVLKENALFSDYSGIHYHIDCTDIFSKITRSILAKYHDWILEELETWNYQGTYNSKGFSNVSDLCNKEGNTTSIMYGNWVRFQPYFKTIEFRIGSMTFEYTELFKKITHANKIVETFVQDIIIENIKESNPIILYEDDVTKVLKNRIKKI